MGRKHNIFGKKKIDSGGNANRNSFNTIFHWLWNNNKNQWEEFVNNKIYEKSAMELWWESKKVIPKEDREKLSGYYGGIK